MGIVESLEHRGEVSLQTSILLGRKQWAMLTDGGHGNTDH